MACVKFFSVIRKSFFSCFLYCYFRSNTFRFNNPPRQPDKGSESDVRTMVCSINLNGNLCFVSVSAGN